VVEFVLGIAGAAILFVCAWWAGKQKYDEGFDEGEDVGYAAGFEAGKQQGLSEIPDQLQRLMKQPELFGEWLEGAKASGRK
jgi:flagellar biosynthesis/type III secretory pathway protein FliH